MNRRAVFSSFEENEFLVLVQHRGKSEGKNYRIIMKISSIQKDILTGTILGDGYLQKTGDRNARLRLEHGFKQKEYLLWKVSQLQPFFQGHATYLERVHPITKRTYKYWRHQSQAMPLLGKLRALFYPDGTKHIPDRIKTLLTPRSLAVWYMDDGYYYLRDRCAYLYLGNVTKEEAEYVANVMNQKFDLEVRVLAKKKGFAIYFSPAQVLKLKAIIHSHVLPYFKYKLPS